MFAMTKETRTRRNQFNREIGQVTLKYINILTNSIYFMNTLVQNLGLYTYSKLVTYLLSLNAVVKNAWLIFT